MSNTLKTFLVIVCIVVLACLVFLLKRPDQLMPVMSSIPAGWATTTDQGSGVTYGYPLTVSTQYIATSPTYWPPKVTVSSYAYSCISAGSPVAPTGQTVERTINGHTYCVTMESEGAAGSTYNTYAYTFVNHSKTMILTLTLRYPQCDNYGDSNTDPRQTACKVEESTFNVDQLVDQIAQTIH